MKWFLLLGGALAMYMAVYFTAPGDKPECVKGSVIALTTGC